ncbi:MAG: hypothetical protein KAU31_03870, partial [Spirochaetaceae bacterium]|nr:hypothetical protein [Spirochaetaceae bacterium]
EDSDTTGRRPADESTYETIALLIGYWVFHGKEYSTRRAELSSLPLAWRQVRDAILAMAT